MARPRRRRGLSKAGAGDRLDLSGGRVGLLDHEDIAEHAWGQGAFDDRSDRGALDSILLLPAVRDGQGHLVRILAWATQHLL